MNQLNIQGTAKPALKSLRVAVESGYGKKCKEYVFGCFVCLAHRNLEDMEELIDNLDEENS